MKFQNPSMHGFWRTDARTDGRTHNPKQICSHNFFEVGGIIKMVANTTEALNHLFVHNKYHILVFLLELLAKKMLCSVSFVSQYISTFASKRTFVKRWTSADLAVFNKFFSSNISGRGQGDIERLYAMKHHLGLEGISSLSILEPATSWSEFGIPYHFVFITDVCCGISVHPNICYTWNIKTNHGSLWWWW